MATFLNESYFNGKNGSYFKLILEYDAVVNQNLNNHDVTYYLYFQSLNGYSGSGASNSVRGYVKDNPVGTTSSIGKNQKLLLGSYTETVQHDNNGEGSTTYTALIDTGWTLGDASVNGTLVLPKINRVSTWGFTTNQMSNIEDTLVLKINKYISSYTNKVTISNLQNDEIIRTIDNVIDGYELKFTDKELEQIYTLDSNETKQNLRFYLNLYSYDVDGNLVGDAQRIYINAYILDSNPTFTYTIVETEQRVIDLFENDTAEYIVKSVSKPKVTVDATALKGATIKTISIVNSTQANANENPYVFENVQTGTFTIVVTDSRGLTKTEVVTRHLINYTPVYINTYSFERENQTSANIILNADITCYSGSFNSMQNAPIIMYKVGTNGEYVEINEGFTFENNKLIFNDYTLENILPYTETDKIYLYVLDLLTEDTENEIVSKGIATFEAGEHDFQVNGDLIVADENRENKHKVAIKYDIITDGKYTPAGFTLDGKEGYIERIDLGSLPNSSTKETLTDIPKNATILEINCFAISGNNLVFIPLTNPTDSSYQIALTLYKSDSYWGVRIATGRDRTDFNGYINIYFAM